MTGGILQAATTRKRMTATNRRTFGKLQRT
jgi:hypothetical protein